MEIMNSSIVFFSSTEFGASVLEKLIDTNENVVAVVTRTDKVRKRGNKVDSRFASLNLQFGRNYDPTSRR